MTLNGKMAHILRYLTELGSFQGAYRAKVIEDKRKHFATEM